MVLLLPLLCAALTLSHSHSLALSRCRSFRSFTLSFFGSFAQNGQPFTVKCESPSLDTERRKKIYQINNTQTHCVYALLSSALRFRLSVLSAYKRETVATTLLFILHARRQMPNLSVRTNCVWEWLWVQTRNAQIYTHTHACNEVARSRVHTKQALVRGAHTRLNRMWLRRQWMQLNSS